MQAPSSRFGNTLGLPPARNTVRCDRLPPPRLVHQPRLQPDRRGVHPRRHQRARLSSARSARAHQRPATPHAGQPSRDRRHALPRCAPYATCGPAATVGCCSVAAPRHSPRPNSTSTRSCPFCAPTSSGGRRRSASSSTAWAPIHRTMTCAGLRPRTRRSGSPFRSSRNDSHRPGSRTTGMRVRNRSLTALRDGAAGRLGAYGATHTAFSWPPCRRGAAMCGRPSTAGLEKPPRRPLGSIGGVPME